MKQPLRVVIVPPSALLVSNWRPLKTSTTALSSEITVALRALRTSGRLRRMMPTRPVVSTMRW